MNVCYPLNNLEIITTLFSVYPGQHDQESGVIGSFANTIKAIHKLLLYGTRVTLKLCITKNNYLQLNSFYDFMRTEFSDDVNFQISGIDYIGMSEKTRYQMMLTCEQIRSQLDPLLKKINYLKLRHLDNRVVFISNLPLCAASLDYSNYFVLNGEMGQIDYLSAQKDMKSRYYDSIKGSELCFQCIAYDNCPGTYSSTFQVMGDAYVTPFR